jgi:hypothetical protein
MESKQGRHRGLIVISRKTSWLCRSLLASATYPTHDYARLTAREVVPNHLTDTVHALRGMVRVVVHHRSLEARFVSDVEVTCTEEMVEALYERAVPADELDEVIRIVWGEEAFKLYDVSLWELRQMEGRDALYSQEELSYIPLKLGCCSEQ